MNDETPQGENQPDLSIATEIDQACDRFEAAWLRGERLLIEDALLAGRLSCRDTLFRELLEIELQLRQQAGETPDPAEYRRRFPEHLEAIEAVLSKAVPHRRLGDYELLEELGHGGMGVVYRARQVLLNQIVALKVLPERYLNEPKAIARFRREMQSIGGLEHPNIVRAHNAGETKGVHFLVMEFVDGVDLLQLVSRQGPLGIGAACETIRQAALGLQYACEHGLVHRDIKPANLILGRSGVVKILDLGLARFYAEYHPAEPSAASLTQAGTTLGTVDYMAPEQWENASSVDIRADIYSLGCTLFFLVTGQPPYGGESFASHRKRLMAHVIAPIPSLAEYLPECPQALEAVFQRMLAKEPDERFSTPAEVAESLGPLAAPERLAEVIVAMKGIEPGTAGSAPRITGSNAGTVREIRPFSGPQPGLSSRRAAADPASLRRLRGVLWASVAVSLAVMIGVAVWQQNRPAAPAPLNRLRAELALLPALNGDWWFNETPWMVPFVRRAIVQALDDPQSMALLGGDADAGMALLTDPDVRAAQERLRELAERCLPALSPAQRALLGELIAVSQSDLDEKELGPRLQTCLDAFLAPPDDPSSRHAVDWHTKAVIEHKLAALANNGEMAQRACESYETALEEYRRAPSEEPPLQLLCQADSARLYARNMGDDRDIKQRYQKAKERFDKARSAREAPVLFQVDVLVSQGDAASVAGEYGDCDHAFKTAEEAMAALGERAANHPLLAYVYEEYAWNLTDRWEIDKAWEKFIHADDIRKRAVKDKVKLQLQEGENEVAQVHVFHDQHGQAILLRYMGKAMAARARFRDLLRDIEDALAAADRRRAGIARQRYRGKLVERLYNSSERYADCMLFQGAASDPQLADLKTACNLYAKACDNAKDPAVRTVMVYKRAIAMALAGVPPSEVRLEIQPANLPRQKVIGEESERARLLQHVAEAVVAFKEKGPPDGRDAFARFLRQLVHGEFTPSDRHRREAFELQLLCAELLISSSLRNQATARTAVADLEYLDPLLNTAFPSRDSMLPFLRRFYELAISAVGESDPGRVAGYLLASRGQSRSDDGRTLVLFHLRSKAGMAIVAPPLAQGECKWFALGFGREEVKQQLRDAPRKLPRELGQLVKSERDAGRTLDVRWSDKECWSDPGQALSNKEYPFSAELPLPAAAPPAPPR